MSDNLFLDSRWELLVNNLKSPVIHSILDRLRSKINLSEEEYASVFLYKGTDHDKVRILLPLVSSRGEPAIEAFMEAIKELNPELYQRLEHTEEGESVTLEKALYLSDHHDSDDSGCSGTPSDEEEVHRCAELARTMGEVNEQIDKLEKEAKKFRQNGCMEDTERTYRELTRLSGLCTKEARGNLGICVSSLNRESVEKDLQNIYDDGSLGQKVQEGFNDLVKDSDKISRVKTSIGLVWEKEKDNRQEADSKVYAGIIKVSAKEFELADDYVLEEGSEGAFECLCDYLVKNPDELDPVIEYLNNIKVQVCRISRGCIKVEVLCLNEDSSSCLNKEYNSGRLAEQFQELFSAFLKQFGLKSLVLDVKYTLSQAISGPPTTASLTVHTTDKPTDTANTGILEEVDNQEEEVQEEHFASNTALSLLTKAPNTPGLDRTTSVDNLIALPSPIKHVEHSNLRGLFLAMVGGKDQSCADAADDGSRLNFTVRQVQTALQIRSKRAQQQQNDVLKAAREDTDAIIHSLHQEVTRRTQENEKVQKIFLDLKKENHELKETNKAIEVNIEKLTDEHTKLTNQLPDLHDQVKSLSEKQKKSQTALSEKTLEIQLLQETNEDMAARIEELLGAMHLVGGKHQGKALRKEKRDSVTEKRQSGPEDASDASVKERMRDTAVMPRDVSVADTRENSIMVTCAAAGNTDYYIVTLSHVDGSMSLRKHVTAEAMINGQDNMCTFTDLIPGTLYNISVRAVSGGMKSEEVTVFHRTRPAQPHGISIANSTKNSISITWAAATGNTDYYIVTLSHVDGSMSLRKHVTAEAMINGQDNMYTFTGLTPGTLYNISVRAVSGEMESEEVIVRYRARPAQPHAISIANSTKNSISITWAAATGDTDYYTLTLSHVDGSKSLCKHIIDGQHHMHTFTGLTPGTLYNISVRAVSGEMESEEVIVLHRTSPAQAGEISIANITENSISITWAGAEGNRDSYHISISPDEGDNPIAIVDAGAPLEHTFTGLTPGGQYTISVITMSVDCHSAAVTRHQRTKGASADPHQQKAECSVVPLVEQETDVLKEDQTPKMEIKIDDLGSKEQKIFHNFAERMKVMTNDQSPEEMLQTLQEEVGQHIGEEAWMEQAHVRIGIIGVSGTGKSTFINSFRGLRAGDPGAAEVGTTETTMQTAEYPHPIHKNVILVDFPGALFKLDTGWLRPVSFDMKEYTRKFGHKMKECDVFLVFTSDRVHDNAVWISRKIKDTGKNVLFVRSKFDRDVEDKKRDNPAYFERGQAEGEEQLLQKHRQDCVTKLETMGYGRADVGDVFIISGLLDHIQHSRWDASTLNEAILKQLDIQQKMLFVMTCKDYSATMVKAKAKIYKSRAWKVALGAAAGGAIPFAATGVTIGSLVAAGALFKKGFGLNEASLHKLATLTGKSAVELQKFVDDRLGILKKITQFFEGKIDKRTLEEALVAAGAGGALAAAIAMDVAVDMAVPFVGGLVTAPISFGLVWKALHLIIEQQEQCTLALHEYAFH